MKMKTKISLVVLLLGCLVGWSARAADAGATFAASCASCHGKDGKGQTMMGRKLGAPDFTDAKVQASLTDADAVKTIKEGKTKDGKLLMKPFDKLSDDDVKALVAYIRGLK